MYPLLILIFALSLPALADGAGSILSFFLAGGPAIPIIAILLAHKWVGKQLKNSTTTSIAFLLSIPAAIAGFRYSFRFLMSQDEMVAGEGSIFFGPLVLLSSLFLSCHPGLLLSLAPACSSYPPSGRNESLAVRFVRKVPVLTVLITSLVLAYWAL